LKFPSFADQIKLSAELFFLFRITCKFKPIEPSFGRIAKIPESKERIVQFSAHTPLGPINSYSSLIAIAMLKWENFKNTFLLQKRIKQLLA
jgi:hypothetical protein